MPITEGGWENEEVESMTDLLHNRQGEKCPRCKKETLVQQGGEDIWCADDECNWEEGDSAEPEETIGDGWGCPCPYCKKDCPWTGDPIGEDVHLETECEHCGKTFIIRASHSVTHWGRPK
jgi:ribosomal protein L37AE/L43A